MVLPFVLHLYHTSQRNMKALATVNEFRSAGKLKLDDKLRFWSLLKRRAAGEDVQGEIDNLLNKII